MADGMIVYIENLKESIKNFLQLTSEYRKVARYKINIKKSNAFLHANKEQVGFEIKSAIPFTLASPQNRILIK